jgi:two-component system, chemotaxis family, CheB/CheR fusion protein
MNQQQTGFPIAVIGASGKSPDALIAFLTALQPSLPIAYIIFIEPDTDISIDTLRSVSPIPITEIVNVLEPAPGHIYIVPEQNAVSLSNDTLQLVRLTRSDVNTMPLDASMAAVAEKYGAFSIGVLLSGATADGVMGMKKIKEAGGATFLQHPETAHYKMRLNDAVACNAVDIVTSAETMPAKLGNAYEAYLACHAYPNDKLITPVEDGVFGQMQWLIFIRTGIDFRLHNQTFIRRRIACRMAVVGTHTPTDYLAILKKNKPEQEHLFDALLPTFSHFSEHPELFEQLTQTVLPALTPEAADKPLRIWVINCGTGQIAYSVAMAVRQSIDTQKIKVQIFASDLSAKAIESARTGIYLPQELQELPRELRDVYFTKKGGYYYAAHEIRQLCIFSVHDAIKDPPFSKIDLIICDGATRRYLAATRDKLFSLLHYAMSPDGMLFTKASDSHEKLVALFEPATLAPDFYRPKRVPRNSLLKTQTLERIGKLPGFGSAKKSSNPTELFLAHAPVGVIVDENADIVHFHGDTSPYLQPAAGKPNFNIYRMARPFIEFTIRHALEAATKSAASVTEAVKE